MAGSRFCESCGAALHEGAQFCGGCGYAVAGAETPPSTRPPPVASSPVGDVGSSGASGRRPWLFPALIAVALSAIVALGAVLVFAGGDGGGGEEVQLVSASAAGPDSFTPPVSPVILPTTATTATTASPSAASRTTAGPFGGTGDNTLCDREALVSFLTDSAQAPQAREFARVVGITGAAIPTYVRALVPTTLASDTRVTNHTFQNGRAVGFQAVLQAGTAVLVDTYGKPVVRCRCGNPLLPPTKVSNPVYTGPRWPGFDPVNVIVVQVSPTPVFPPGGTGTLPSSPTTAATPEQPSTGGSANEGQYQATLGAFTCSEGTTSSGEATTLDLTVAGDTVTFTSDRAALQIPPTTVAPDGTFSASFTGPAGDSITASGTFRSGSVEGRIEDSYESIQCSATFSGKRA